MLSGWRGYVVCFGKETELQSSFYQFLYKFGRWGGGLTDKLLQVSWKLGRWEELS